MESFLAGVGLVFIRWEQPVVPRAASPSPVVLVHFSLLASPAQPHAQTSVLGYLSGGQALGRKAEHHVVSRNYWTLVKWWETSGFGGGGTGARELVLSADSCRHPARHFIVRSLNGLKQDIMQPHFSDEAIGFNC